MYLSAVVLSTVLSGTTLTAGVIMKTEYGTGGPVRLLALVNEDDNASVNGAACTLKSSDLFRLLSVAFVNTRYLPGVSYSLLYRVHILFVKKLKQISEQWWLWIAFTQ